jgi:hypothetical protein
MPETDGADFGSVFEFANDISTQEAPPPLPPRSYVGEVTGATARQSNKGNVYIEVEFTVPTEQFPLDFAEKNKEPVKLYYRRLVVQPDTDRNRYAIRKFSEALRVPVGRRLDINDFIGKSGTLKVKSTRYMGEERAEIDAVEMV